MIKRLKSGDLNAQILACEALLELDDATDALPALIDILENGSLEVREAATRVVAAIGPKATTAIPPLVLLLRDRRYWVRDEAAEALIAIGPAALPHVLRAMKSDSARARAAATRAASQIASNRELVLPALSEAMHDPDPRVRATAASGLGRYGSEAVPVLASAAGEKDSCVAVAIAEALKDLHAGPSVAVNALVRLLDDPQSRPSAVLGLQQYGVEARRAIPALVKHYPTDTEDERTGFENPIEIEEALTHIGPPHIDDVAALEQLFESQHTEVRALAAHELRLMGDLGAPRDRAAAALEPALTDVSPAVRMEAARSLWLLTHDTARVLPVLEGAADGEHYVVIRGVSESLQQIGKPAVPTLIRLLTNDNEHVRWWAAEGLGGIGRAASDALPSLVDALTDSDDSVPDAVSRAINRLGDAAAPAVPQLVAAARQGRLDVSQLAIAVTEIGPQAKAAMSLLIEGLKSGDELSRSRIIDAICSIGADDEQTVEVVNSNCKSVGRNLELGVC